MSGKKQIWASLVAQRLKSICLQCGRPGFHPWVRKIPWRRKWQPTPVFLPGESHGWRSLVGYSLWGCKESDTTEWLHFHFQKANICFKSTDFSERYKSNTQMHSCVPVICLLNSDLNRILNLKDEVGCCMLLFNG